MLAGEWGVACTYVLPAEQSRCTRAPAFTSFTGTGQLHLGDAVDSGSQALVAVVGSICVTTAGGASQCGSNSDPRAGLPRAGLDFAQAWATTLSDPASWAAGCDEIGGQWYVDLAS